MKTRPLLPLAALLLLPACGHKGDPLPPLRRTPPTPADFRFAQRGDVLELEATVPGASIDGVAYADRVSVEFLYGTGEIDLEKRGQKRLAAGLPGQRVLATLPLPAPATLVRAAVRGAWSGEHGARSLTKLVLVQPPLEAPRELEASAAEEGVRLSWQGLRPKAADLPPAPRIPGMPAAPGAAAPGAPAKGAPTGTATTGTAATGTAATGTAATGTAATGAAATGTAATGTAATADKPAAGPAVPAGATAPVTVAAPAPRRNGFFVYRRAGNGTYALPLGSEPLDRRNAVDADAPLGERVCYVVRAVSSTDPLVESAASNEACVERRDQTPPATPAGLAILPRSGGLEVLWSPSGESDLAGYRVYREAPGQPRQRLAEVAADKAAYLDETAAKGTTYRFTVTAFDAAGNESEPTDPVEGSLP